MRGRLAFALIMILSSFALHAQTTANTAQNFTINIPESTIGFLIGLPSGDINGVFKTWTGKLSLTTPGVPESSALSLEVASPSMSTGSMLKDRMVKGKDFFSVKDFPIVSFTSSKVIPSGDPKRFQIQGDFTLRGVSKPVVLQVNLDRDNRGGGRVHADLSFDPRDFGMRNNVSDAHETNSVRVLVDLNIAPAPVAAATERYSWAKLIRITVNN